MAITNFSAYIVSFLELTDAAIASGSGFIKIFKSFFITDAVSEAIPMALEDEPIPIQVSLSLDEFGMAPSTDSLIYANGLFQDQGPQLDIQYFVSL